MCNEQVLDSSRQLTTDEDLRHNATTPSLYQPAVDTIDVRESCLTAAEMQRSSLSKMKNKNLVVEQRNLNNNKIGNSSYNKYQTDPTIPNSNRE